jgi:hypothetical protein
LIAGTVVGYLSLLFLTPVALAVGLAEQYGAFLTITEISSTLFTNILALTTTALLAGYFAIAYRALVPDSGARPTSEKGSPVGPPQSNPQI